MQVTIRTITNSQSHRKLQAEKAAAGCSVENRTAWLDPALECRTDYGTQAKQPQLTIRLVEARDPAITPPGVGAVIEFGRLNLRSKLRAVQRYRFRVPLANGFTFRKYLLRRIMGKEADTR